MRASAPMFEVERTRVGYRPLAGRLRFRPREPERPLGWSIPCSRQRADGARGLMDRLEGRTIRRVTACSKVCWLVPSRVSHLPEKRELCPAQMVNQTTLVDPKDHPCVPHRVIVHEQRGSNRLVSPRPTSVGRASHAPSTWSSVRSLRPSRTCRSPGPARPVSASSGTRARR